MSPFPAKIVAFLCANLPIWVCSVRKPKSLFVWRWCAPRVWCVLMIALVVSPLVLAPKSWGQAPAAMNPLYSFSNVSSYPYTNQDGGEAVYGVVRDEDGKIYGTTQLGGSHGSGTIFRFTFEEGLTTLYNFPARSVPGGLIQGEDGNFYGTTNRGGERDEGTVFQVTLTGVLTILHSFNSEIDGSFPGSNLLQGKDGNFYGTATAPGSTASFHTIFFQLTPTGRITTLHQFGDGEGVLAGRGIIQGSDGCFYGTSPAGAGGRYGGSVYKLTPEGVMTTLHIFNPLDPDAHNAQNIDGEDPLVLVQGNDGNFYGVTRYGGPNGGGTVFRLTPAGALTTLHNFDDVGPRQFASLLLGKDGNFYGSSQFGGASGAGTIYKVTPAGVFTTVYAFGSEYYEPAFGLSQGSDGNLYGTTYESGEYADGSIYQIVLPQSPIPIITSAPTAGGRVGAPFLYQAAASNAPISYAVSGLPDGLGVNAATGLISGTPTAAGTFPVTLSATNAAGTGTAALTLTITAARPSASLVATIPQVTAGTDNFAEFTVGLSAAQDHDVVLNLLVAGSAVNGTDYAMLKTSKKLKAGQTSRTLKIRPLGAGPGEGSKRTVILTLAPGDGYEPGTMAKAKVKIIGR